LPDITYRNKYSEVHRVNGTMINQNQRNAELVSSLGYKTFAVIHDTTDYGKGHNKYFSEALTRHGGKILGTFGVTSDQQDFSAELTQIKSLNPQAKLVSVEFTESIADAIDIATITDGELETLPSNEKHLFKLHTTPTDDAVRFRGGFLFDQFVPIEKYNYAKGSDPEPALRWPLIREITVDGKRHFSELLLGQANAVRFRFNLILPAPIPQTRAQLGSDGHHALLQAQGHLGRPLPAEGSG
jgi:Periplasmic binding protein